LIHGLQGLFVLVEDLEVIDGGGCLNVRRGREAGEVGDGASADYKDEGESGDQGGAELATGVEEKTAADALEPACGRSGLLFAETDGQLLVEVGRRLRCAPLIEEIKGSLEGCELIVAGRAGFKVSAGGCSGGRSREESFGSFCSS
jgi:hypothetical protein